MKINTSGMCIYIYKKKTCLKYIDTIGIKSLKHLKRKLNSDMFLFPSTQQSSFLLTMVGLMLPFFLHPTQYKLTSLSVNDSTGME